MSILKEFEKAVVLLTEKQVKFAVVGGMAANLYRPEIRGTLDVDFAIFAEDEKLIAKDVLENLGLKASLATGADLEGGPLFKKKQSPVLVVVGRNKKEKGSVGVDFLLSEIPWVNKAVENAQKNRMDYGFGPVPTITVEDLLIAKLYAVSKDKTRYKDLDDIQSILHGGNPIKASYLCERLKESELFFPKNLHELLDPAVGRISRKIERRLKKKGSLAV